MRLSLLVVLLCAVAAVCAEVIPQVGEPVTFRSVEEDLTQQKRGYTLSVSPAQGPAGGVITVTYAGSTVSNTWIGVFATGSYSTSLFKYVSTASGKITFSTAGLAAGKYNIYYVYNSYIQATATYTVSGSATTSSTTGATSGSTTGSTTGSTSGGGGGDATAWVNAHNTRRAARGIPAVSWSAKLAASAQSWANTMASQCNMRHSGKSGVGENIAYGYGSIEAVMQAWSDQEAANYNPATKQCVSGRVCGHFTQVNWRSTNKIGCGKAFCGSTPYYACQYIRPGNCNNYDYTQSNSPCPNFDDSSL